MENVVKHELVSKGVKMKKGIIALGISCSLLGVFSTQPIAKPQSVHAASTMKYGADRKFTVPRKMRGAWVSRSKKSAYKSFKFTAHTVTFTGPSYYYKRYNGKWNLYHMNDKWYSKYMYTMTGARANSYAQKHHWLATRKDRGGKYFFKLDWTNDNGFSFFLNNKSKNVLHFENESYNNDYYRR